MKSDHKKLVKQCDDLWREIIFLKAGYRSEISTLPGKKIDSENGRILQAHHIARKPNYRLRYELDNGICMTIGEHRYGIHGNYEEKFRKAIMEVKGSDIYDRLYPLRNETVKDLGLVKLFLEGELKKLKESSICET